jgi:hypothetical protein
MHTQNLFTDILLAPANNRCNRLCIVSGYATAAMAFHHFEELQQRNHNVSVSLIVGMCATDGLSQSNHRAFQELMQTTHSGRFECSYLINPPPVHSKVYCWLRDDEPVQGYLGSANYTQTAFSTSQREAMATAPATNAFEYFQSLIPQTTYCTHIDAENLIQIYNDSYFARLRREQVVQQQEHTMPNPNAIQNWAGLPSVTISFLDRSGNLPQRSGLNWGQRPEEQREPNQAYIKLPSSVYRTDFFPERTVHFTVLTDDNRVLTCTRAQDNGKAIHTPHNNSLIGEYFRNRLGLPNGSPVLLNDLNRYGRTDVTFYKIDDETFYMDFSVQP